jgi:hypothetical protein
MEKTIALTRRPLLMNCTGTEAFPWLLTTTSL